VKLATVRIQQLRPDKLTETSKRAESVRIVECVCVDNITVNWLVLDISLDVTRVDSLLSQSSGTAIDTFCSIAIVLRVEIKQDVLDRVGQLNENQCQSKK
jgi:hypothetical protein